MNGYFAVQLDRSSCNVVKKRATFPNIVSDHITLAYKPTKKIYNKNKGGKNNLQNTTRKGPK